MVNATPGRFCAALALLLGYTGIAGAAPLPQTPDNANAGSMLVFTDLGTSAAAQTPQLTRSTSLPEPASTGVVCLGLAAIACHFRRRRAA